MGKRRETCSDCVGHSYRMHNKTDDRGSCFVKVMIGDFAEQLRIPPAFVKHIENKGSNKVILEGPSEKLWNLTLERTCKGVFLRRGWKKFLKDHSIQLGEFLVFRYNGDLHFTVQIFDTTACEKEVSFHVENEGFVFNEENQLGEEVTVELTRKNERGQSRKRPHVEDVDEPIFNEENKELEEVKVEPIQMNGKGRPGKKPVTLPRQINSNSITIKKVLIKQENKRGTTVLGPSAPPPAKRKRKSGITILDSSGQLLNCDTKRLNVGSNSSYFASKDEDVQITSEYKCQYFMSLRRPVTKQEKVRAYEAASSFKSRRPCVQLVMARSHVSVGFFVQLPNKFVRTHFPQESRYINLRIPSGRKWPVHYIYREGNGALSGGWKHFSLMNNLEEGDVCVLERVYPDFVFTVHIFRVVANPSSKLPVPRVGKTLYCSKSSLPKALLAEIK